MNKHITLGEFIAASSAQIVEEWAEFARTCSPAGGGMDLVQRRDHVAGMLKAIALDLGTAQSDEQQSEKSKGQEDGHVDSHTAATAHGTDRAATGYTPAEMLAEFRALRASVLRLWSESQTEFGRESLREVTRFNEAIDQLLAESIARYSQDVDRSRDLFLGILGHDLRNPLGAIMGSASMIMTRAGHSDSLHVRRASLILKSGRRMVSMIDDLVDFTRSRLGAGIPIVRADMDMAATCRQTAEEISAFHPQFRVAFEASGELHGQWDAARIAQVLSNLVGNAYQHGGATAPVELSVRGEPDRVVITVHNEGPVIPQSKLHDIFNPFRQIDSDGRARDLRSAGLGLYISQAIVRGHQGTIDVASDTSGTSFTVSLPRAAEHDLRTLTS